MSSERGKFGEPWKLAQKKWRFRVGLNIVRTGMRGPIGLESSRRAVACVNAFDGTKDPAAELARLRAIEAAARDYLCSQTLPDLVLGTGRKYPEEALRNLHDALEKPR